MIHSGLWSKEIKEYRYVFVLGLLFTILIGFIGPYYYDRVLEIPGGIEAWGEIIASSFHQESWVYWNSVVLLQFSVIMAIALGVGSLSREVTNKTLDYLLSYPVSLREILTTKIVAGTTILVFYIYISSLLFGLFTWYIGFSFPVPQQFFLSSTVTLMVALVAYMSAVFLSALFLRTWSAAAAAIILWGMIIALDLDWLSQGHGFLSPMRDAGFWLGNETAFIPIGVGAVFILILYEISAFFWTRREL